MNDEYELYQTNSTSNASLQQGYYLPTIIALDGDKVKERTNNNNISIISINEPNFSSIENTINATSNVSVAGFSRAGVSAIYQSAKAIANGATISSVFVIDDGTPHVDRQVYRDAVQTIANSGTSIFFIGQHSKNNNRVMRADAQEYAKTAGTAILIRNTNTSGHGSGYNQIYTRTMSDNLVGYLNGAGALINTQDYAFDIFDNATQTWTTYNYDQFQAKVDSGEIKLNDAITPQSQSSYTPLSFKAGELVDSDKDLIEDYMNNIRAKLMLESNVHSYSSTTAIPNSESEAVQQFFEGTYKLFQALESDTRYILDVANKIEDIDKLLEKRLENMKDAPIMENSSNKRTFKEITDMFINNIMEGYKTGSETGLFFTKAGNMLGGVIGADIGVIKSVIGLIFPSTVKKEENTTEAEMEN